MTKPDTTADTEAQLQLKIKSLEVALGDYQALVKKQGQELADRRERTIGLVDYLLGHQTR